LFFFVKFLLNFFIGDMMKKLFYAVIAAIFMPAVMFAGNDITATPLQTEYVPLPAEMLSTPNLDKPVIRVEKKAQLQDTDVPYWGNLVQNPLEEDRLLMNYGGTTHNPTSQFFYDPASGIIGILSASYELESDDSGNLTGNSTYNYQLTYSYDYGQSWEAKAYPTLEGKMVIQYPSGGITNPNGSNDIEDINLMAYSRNYTWGLQDGQESFWVDGISLCWWADKSWNDGGDPFPQRRPDNGSDWRYTMGSASVYMKDGENVITGAQRLDTDADDAQWGVYGQASFAFPSYNTSFNIPDSWEGSNFYKPDDVPFTSTQNSGVFQTTDGQGNVYVAMLNQFMENPDFTRTVGVSMSDDMGMTWSDFNVCPPSVADAYIVEKGAMTEWTQDMVDWYIAETENTSYQQNLGVKMFGVNMPFQSKTMVAFGPDNYSVFTTIRLYYEVDGAYESEVEIIEYHWDGSAWEIIPVTQIGGYNYNTLSEGSDGLIYVRESYYEDGFNLDAARTADGENVVLSWIDMTNEVELSEPLDCQYPYNGSYVDYQLTTVLASDVFVAARGKDSKDWEGFQLTAEEGDTNQHFSKGVQMPEVVPSLNNIVMVCNASLSSTDDPFRELDDILMEIRTDRWMGYYVLSADFNEQDKYYFAPEQNVLDDINVESSFTLNTPYPNPASTSADVTFSIENASPVTVKVYDTVGNEVMEVYNQYASAGIHGLTINTSSLAAGTYYIVLSNGSANTTQMLNVIR
jgi:hypothetical protein